MFFYLRERIVYTFFFCSLIFFSLSQNPLSGSREKENDYKELLFPEDLPEECLMERLHVQHFFFTLSNLSGELPMQQIIRAHPQRWL